MKKVIIIIIIIIIIITFMEGISNYIPETNHVSRVYSFAAILSLQLMVYVMQFPMTYVLYILL